MAGFLPAPELTLDSKEALLSATPSARGASSAGYPPLPLDNVHGGQVVLCKGDFDNAWIPAFVLRSGSTSLQQVRSNAVRELCFFELGVFHLARPFVGEVEETHLTLDATLAMADYIDTPNSYVLADDERRVMFEYQQCLRTIARVNRNALIYRNRPDAGGSHSYGEHVRHATLARERLESELGWSPTQVDLALALLPNTSFRDIFEVVHNL